MSYVYIDYTNYRGERKTYRIQPIRIWYGQTEHHRGDQWLLDATDINRGVQRTFAMKDLHDWTPEQKDETTKMAIGPDARLHGDGGLRADDSGSAKLA